MHEIYIPDAYADFSASLTQKFLQTDGRGLCKEDVRRIAAEQNVEILGSGRESVILPHPEDHKKVVSIGYWAWEHKEIVEVFYFQRLMSTLFPYNFPQFSAVFSGSLDENMRPNGTIRERVVACEPNKKRGNKDKVINLIRGRRGRVRHPFSDVTNALRELTIPDIFTNDNNPDNFLLSEEGGEYWVDNVHDFKDYLNPNLLRYMDNKDWFNPKAIDEYMAKHRYSQIDKRTVNTCIQRLRKVLLGEEIVKAA